MHNTYILSLTPDWHRGELKPECEQLMLQPALKCAPLSPRPFPSTPFSLIGVSVYPYIRLEANLPAPRYLNVT